MVSSIISKIPIKFGSAFLKAGLIPVLIGWIIYHIVNSSFLETFSALLEVNGNKEFKFHPVLTQVFIVMTLSLILLGIREYVFLFAQQIPLKVLRPTRKWLVKTQLKKKASMSLKLEEIRFDYRIAMWPSLKFNEARSNPFDMKPEEDWLIISEKGRNTVVALAKAWNKDNILTSHQSQEIFNGLKALYLKSVCDKSDDTVLKEISKWKDLLHLPKKKQVKEIFDQISDQRNRNYNLERLTKDNYPDNEFIMPTGLGNIMSTIDDFGKKVFGIQTGVLWSLVLNVLDKEQQAAVADKKLEIQMYLNIGLILLINVVIILVLGCKEWVDYFSINPEYYYPELLSGGYTAMTILLVKSMAFFLISLGVIAALYILNVQLINSTAIQFKEIIFMLVTLKKQDVLEKMHIKVATSEKEYEVLEKINHAFMANKRLTGITYTTK